MQLASGRTYVLGRDYRDSGSKSDSEDQLLRWLNVDGSGIRNMGGIRPLRYVSMSAPAHAYIVLVTDDRSRGSASNPWDDLVDLPHGRIVYWGDAKFDPTKAVDDFVGNRAIRAAFEAVLDNTRPLIPPILHFSKRQVGAVRFNGLCVLDRLELTWFEDHGRPVRNYRAHLTVLNEAEVEVDWLHRRVHATSLAELERDGPAAWLRYEAGFVDRLRVWAASVRSTQAQLPSPGSKDASILGQLSGMTPTGFEAAVVSLLGEMDEVRHNINRTRPTSDGGFDFAGTFTLPPPLQYEISFLGEAKKFGPTTAVGPGHVSRLVARLGRGQYGVFVTTSYFTRQAQEEVLADGYPTTLVAGADLVRIMRELRVVNHDEISGKWLAAVQSELARAPVDVRRAAEKPASYGSRA